jgi:GT2 family glycosyltransferase
MKIPIKLSVIIVNYNTQILLGRCLKALYDSKADFDIEVFIVDNSQTLMQNSSLAQSFPQVILIENDKNIGFAAANNIAIKKGKGEYILLLNPDAFVCEDTIQQMVGMMEKSPGVGIIGAKLIDENGGLHPQPSCTGIAQSPAQALFEYTNLDRLFPKHRLVKEYFLSEWDHRSIREVAMVQGACAMIRRKTIDDIGLLDERFFIYWEDADWCLRAKKRGWKVIYLPLAQCVHLGGQSLVNKDQDYFQFFRGMYLFHKKHYGLLQAVLLRLALACAFLFGYLKSILIYVVFPRRRVNKRQDMKRLYYRIAAIAGVKRPVR